LCTDVKEPRMKDAPWLANVAERRKIWLERGILESIFLFFSPNWDDITVHTTYELILAYLRLTSHVRITIQVDFSQYGCFESFPFRQILLFSSARSRDFDGLPGTELPMWMCATKTPIDMCRFNVRSST